MRIFFLLLFCAFSTQAFSQRGNPRGYQKEYQNEGSILLVNALYARHRPGEDLAGRFGSNFSTGIGLDYLTKGNFIFGAQADFLFGNNVKTDVLATLRNEDGLIFDDNGPIADPQLRQRGFYVGGHIGKIFPIGSNPRSGIRLTLGGGFFKHKIKIQDDPQATIGLLSDAYKKGYDRLSNGPALTQFIGYQMLSKSRRINFLAGFEFTQGFTENRRSINFDTREKESLKRLDLLYGFRIGWTLPFYINENPDELRY